MLLCLICSASVAISQESDSTEASDDDYEEQVEKAFLIVRKKVFEPDVVIGRNITVTISIYNAGNRQGPCFPFRAGCAARVIGSCPPC